MMAKRDRSSTVSTPMGGEATCTDILPLPARVLVQEDRGVGARPPFRNPPRSASTDAAATPRGGSITDRPARRRAVWGRRVAQRVLADRTPAARERTPRAWHDDQG